MKKQKTVRVVHTRAQKIWGSLALAGLFLCGIMVGLGINGRPEPVATNAVADTSAVVTDAPAETCEIIEEILMRDLMPVDSDYVKDHEFNITVYEKLIMNGCSENQMKYHKLAQQERDIVNALQQNAVADTSAVVTDAPAETCEIIEELLLERLYPVDSQEVEAHEYNISVYEKLVMNGCSQNQQKYHNAAVREREIVAALQVADSSQQTCEQIESLLLSQLPKADGDSGWRIERAKIYANLSERGCPGNSAKYVEMAARELEIARALEDDEFSNQQTVEVVETYKRLNMQAAAEQVFDMAKRLTNPTIDFILEVEKIINAQ